MRDKTSIIDIEMYALGSESYYSSLTLDAQKVSSSEVEEFAVTMTIHDKEIGMAEAMLNYDHEAFELVSCNLTGDFIHESSLKSTTTLSPFTTFPTTLPSTVETLLMWHRRRLVLRGYANTQSINHSGRALLVAPFFRSLICYVARLIQADGFAHNNRFGFGKGLEKVFGARPNFAHIVVALILVIA